MIHKLVTQWAGEASIKQLCLALGVSRSGYYAARARQAQPKALCHDSLHIKAAFAASGNTYGSRRLQAALCAQGLVIGRYRCRSLMQAHGLHAQWRRKFAHTTDSKHALAVAGNVLDRQFTVQ